MLDFRKNYYEILGVDSEASLADLKAAYRKLARRYHPDLNPGNKAAEERFKDIVEAYDVLGDEEQRSQYDELSPWGKGKKGKKKVASSNRNGTAPPRREPTASYSRRSSASSSTQTRRRIPLDEEDIYDRTTKKTYTASSEPRRDRRRDVEARLTIPLEKAYRGGRERIRLEDGRSLEVEMLPAMVDGQQIRLRGQGIAGGDLYLKVEIEPHPHFELQGTDIYCKVPITPSEAVLGGAVEVPTLDGLVKMTVPPGVVSGKRLRLANKGYPRGEDGDRGDQLVELAIVVPAEPTLEEKTLYEKLRQVETFNPRREMLKPRS